MKKKNPPKDAKKQKVQLKRALYEKARKQEYALEKRAKLAEAKLLANSQE